MSDEPLTGYPAALIRIADLEQENERLRSDPRLQPEHVSLLDRAEQAEQQLAEARSVMADLCIDICPSCRIHIGRGFAHQERCRLAAILKETP